MSTSEDSGPRRESKNGLAIASVVLGVIGCLGGVLVVGGFFGAVGLLLGLIHLARRQRSNGLAWAGMTISVLGMSLSICLAVVYYRALMHFVEQIRENMANQTIDHDQWKGVLAPDLTVTLLDGATVTLSELKGKRVIIDFWATWCPPCVREIPHFVQLRDEISPDELVIIGISDEDEDTLRKFQKDHKVNYPIASANGLPLPFGNNGSIPTTYFIDRNGVIQEITVGYREFEVLKSHATAADYEGEPKAAPTMAQSGLVNSSVPLELAEVWSVNIPGGQGLCVGDWDADGSNEVLVSGSKGLHIVDFEGQTKGTVSLTDKFNEIELGRRRGSTPRLLGYSSWGEKVTVVDTTGKVAWSYSANSGVDGAHWGDLDGDGNDDMVIGMNGSGGLHAVSSDGKKMWEVTDIGNVWNQAVIPPHNGLPGFVFATEAGGSVHVFDTNGKRRRTVRPLGKYLSQMAAAREKPDGSVQIIATRDVTVAFDETGRVEWSTPANESDGSWRGKTFASGDIDGDGRREWGFVDITGELVLVSHRGIKLTAIQQQQNTEAFTIVEDPNGTGLLVTLVSGTLRAYRCGP